jgi:hypothetical protein
VKRLERGEAIFEVFAARRSGETFYVLKENTGMKLAFSVYVVAKGCAMLGILRGSQALATGTGNGRESWGRTNDEWFRGKKTRWSSFKRSYTYTHYLMSPPFKSRCSVYCALESGWAVSER